MNEFGHTEPRVIQCSQVEEDTLTLTGFRGKSIKEIYVVVKNNGSNSDIALNKEGVDKLIEIMQNMRNQIWGDE